MKKMINGIKYDIKPCANLQEANLRGVDLRGADLRGANLQGANLRKTDLQKADLRGANLQKADLRGANLQKADLRGANLDFSAFPLWCGSFNMIVDDRLVTQLLTHIREMNTTNCSKRVKRIIKLIPLWVEEDLKGRHILWI